MQNKVKIRLANLFPELKGIDFESFHKLGPRNVLALLHELKNIADYNGDQSHSAMVDCEDELSELVPGDTLRAQELGAQMGYLSLRIGTFKLLESSLKSQLNQAKKDARFVHCPVLPVLRNSACFAPGDDVMVFTGKTGLDEKHDKLRFEHQYKWAVAKILTWTDPMVQDAVFVYTKRPAFPWGMSLEGHQVPYSKGTPLIFGRQEFYCMQQLIQRDYGWGFVLEFLSHCFRYNISQLVPYGSEHFDQLRKIIIDSSVERISDTQLKDEEREWFKTILHELRNAGMIGLFNDLKIAAIEKGYLFKKEEIGEA